MSRTKERQQKNKIRIALIVVSCVLFVVGYYLLNEVSKIHKIPLGATFHVILGCLLMVIPIVYTGYGINKLFFTTKKKKGNKTYFF